MPGTPLTQVFVVQTEIKQAPRCRCYVSAHYTASTMEQAIEDGVKWSKRQLCENGGVEIRGIEVLCLCNLGPLDVDGAEPVRYGKLFIWRRKVDLPLEELIPEKLPQILRYAERTDAFIRTLREQTLTKTT